jgi:putative ATP-dependent endonuclease of OLD family
MKIKKITVTNFRSIQQATIEPSSFCFFVGQNNHGKTNFFDAIEYFYNGVSKNDSIDNIRFNREQSKIVEVAVEFTNVQAGLAAMKNEKHRTTLKNALGDTDNVTISRKEAIKQRQIIVNGTLIDKNLIGLDSALNDFLPKLEYVKTSTHFDDVGKYGKSTPIAIMLSGVLEAIIDQNEQYQKLKQGFTALFEGEDSDVKKEIQGISTQVTEYLQKQFPDCCNIRFEISPPEFSEYLKNFETYVDDGVETTASDKGDGMQRSLMLAIIQAYAAFRKKHEGQGKPFLFLLDEAELHLHPTAQRHLKSALHDICNRGDQVFVNTHSSVLITENLEDQKIFKVKKEDHITTISEISHLDKQNVVYDLLGGSPADLLLPANFLIVEGDSEREFLERVIRRFYANKPAIKILAADGFVSQAGRRIDAINQIYAPVKDIYGEKIVLLADEPNDKNRQKYKEFQQLRHDLVNSKRFFTLPKDSLEDYYPPHLKQDCSQSNKVKLARHVGQQIGKTVFEQDMAVLYQALCRTWELAYGSAQLEPIKVAA